MYNQIVIALYVFAVQKEGFDLLYEGIVRFLPEQIVGGIPHEIPAGFQNDHGDDKPCGSVQISVGKRIDQQADKHAAGRQYIVEGILCNPLVQGRLNSFVDVFILNDHPRFDEDRQKHGKNGHR